MNLIVGIVGSIIAAIIIAMAVAWYKYVFGQRIKIIDPQLHGFLTTAETRLDVVAHQVHGTLKHLRRDHRIWLLVMDDKTGKTWPQGLVPVEYSKEQGTWKGYIHAWGWNNVAIVAVVARGHLRTTSTTSREWDPKRTKILIDAPGQTGVYYDEGGRPMQGSTLVHDAKFQNRVVAETRALLATVPA